VSHTQEIGGDKGGQVTQPRRYKNSELLENVMETKPHSKENCVSDLCSEAHITLFYMPYTDEDYILR
jgi:hypothetical protein